MSEKKKPRTNPRAGSSDGELWDTELDWYFNEFESLCGLQSIGTSGAGENRLRDPTEEEKADRKERIRNGFLLTLPEHAKADMRSTSPGDADRAAFEAMAHGVFRRGRRIWRRLTQLRYTDQVALKQAYEERIPEAGVNWGRPLLTDDQVRAVHKAFRGNPGEPFKESPTIPSEIPSKPWKNPEPIGAPHAWQC